jgi:hypothetical protein
MSKRKGIAAAIGAIATVAAVASVGRHKRSTAYGRHTQEKSTTLERIGTGAAVAGTAAKAVGTVKTVSGVVNADPLKYVGGKIASSTGNKMVDAGIDAVVHAGRMNDKIAGTEGLIAKSQGKSPTLAMRGVSISTRHEGFGKKTSNNGATQEGGPQQHAKADGSTPGDHALVQSMVPHQMADGRVVMRRRQVRAATA